MNVNESVLGWYRIVVTVGAEGRNETESVQLNYPGELSQCSVHVILYILQFCGNG